MKRTFLKAIIIFICFPVFPQNKTAQEEYEAFRKSVQQEYSSFRNECNRQYAEFLREAWDWYEGKVPIPQPKDTPIPPRPYEEKEEQEPITVTPEPLPMPQPVPQPQPFEPIREVPNPDEKYYAFDFYGVPAKVRLPQSVKVGLRDISNKSLADGWQMLCTDEMNNAIRDCLETRIRYNLSDWAYLLFLDQMAQKYCHNPNDATLLMAFLFCQSGYQMRLAIDGNDLKMLFGSKHRIYNKGFFTIDGINFYPYNTDSYKLQICNARFEGETPLSLAIDRELLLGSQLSEPRIIKSRHFETKVQVPLELISFYNTYPTSDLGNNIMTRWAMYAIVPLAQSAKEVLYPGLKAIITGLNELDAVNLLLNWVQTGLVYEYDDKVWGHDRAFFAEETLYYPYADCEDRAILFSRLVRDLIGLDVALVFYPGHLATAVEFKGDVNGDAMMIEGRKFIVCDPTYIGAPVGKQMPDLEYDKTQAIVLNR